jgi:HEPN domain-containing protein
MNDKVKYWLELAEYDLETAKVMLDSGRYLYVGFMCHQIIEKALKACFASRINTLPPYTHNLDLLAEKTGLDKLLSNEQMNLISNLGPLNIECRYPADKEVLAKQLNKVNSNKIYNETEALFQWIKQQL